MDRAVIALALVWAILSAQATPASPPSPPEQPKAGPGGSAYTYERVEAVHAGTAPTGYWLFTPESDSADAPLPVVVFLHGFSAVDPDGYRAWIDHIVRRGAVLIYPDYQTEDLTRTPVVDYQPNATTGIQAALVALADQPDVNVDLSRMAVVGHSLGAVLALNVAALAPAAGLPTVTAVMSVEPGGCAECGGISTLLSVPYEDLSSINPAARVIVMVGDDDTVVGDRGAKVAWAGLTSVPLDRRDFVVLHSDGWGRPELIADHYAPLAGETTEEVDALDWYGTWKFFDLLTDCAFFDQRCVDALGGSETQLYMGTWSDGHPVSPPTITDHP